MLVPSHSIAGVAPEYVTLCYSRNRVESLLFLCKKDRSPGSDEERCSFYFFFVRRPLSKDSSTLACLAASIPRHLQSIMYLHREREPFMISLRHYAGPCLVFIYTQSVRKQCPNAPDALLCGLASTRPLRCSWRWPRPSSPELSAHLPWACRARQTGGTWPR